MNGEMLAVLCPASHALGTEVPDRTAILPDTTDRWHVIVGVGPIFLEAILIAHGGRLAAHNNPDAGAAFSFTLPVSDQGP